MSFSRATDITQVVDTGTLDMAWPLENDSYDNSNILITPGEHVNDDIA